MYDRIIRIIREGWACYLVVFLLGVFLGWSI